MKKISIIFATIALINTSALANEYCNSVAHLSYNIMGARQAGASLEQLMQQVKPFGKLGEILVMDAFHVSQFKTTEYKAKARAEFRDKSHLSCLKGMRK